METRNRTQSNNAAAAAQEATPLTPKAIVEQLRSMRQQIPEYNQLTIRRAASLRRAAHVDADFVQAAINAADASPTVQGAFDRTPDDRRRQTEEAALWTSVEDELKAMLKGVMSANLIRRHEIGTAALQTYYLCRQLVRTPWNANLLPHVAEMKRLNTFGPGRRARARTQAPAPQPAPASSAPHAGLQT